MQLPRGTFREIKKAQLISSLLDDLEHEKFSGICSISSDSVSGTLVFKSGKCILAKILKKTGDEAWDELRNIRDNPVDAALSTLDEAQIQLALEFNKQSRVMKVGKNPPPIISIIQKMADTQDHKQTEKPTAGRVPSPSLRHGSSFTAPPTPRTINPAAPPSKVQAFASLRPAVPATPSDQPMAQAPTGLKPAAPAYPLSHIPVPQQQERKKNAEPEETPQDSTSFENDIETLDTLDLDNVTDKIRNECKTMIKQLELEHLMER